MEGDWVGVEGLKGGGMEGERVVWRDGRGEGEGGG